MQIDATTIALAGAVVNALLLFFSIGVVYGRLSTKISGNSRAIAEIQLKFLTVNGEPILMSYKAHDNICSRNNSLLLEKINHAVEAIEAHTERVETIGNNLYIVKQELAIVKERRSHGQRQDNSQENGL